MFFKYHEIFLCVTIFLACLMMWYVIATQQVNMRNTRALKQYHQKLLEIAQDDQKNFGTNIINSNLNSNVPNKTVGKEESMRYYIRPEKKDVEYKATLIDPVPFINIPYCDYNKKVEEQKRYLMTHNNLQHMFNGMFKTKIEELDEIITKGRGKEGFDVQFTNDPGLTEDEAVQKAFDEEKNQKMRIDQMKFETIEDLKKKMTTDEWGEFIGKTYMTIYEGYKKQKQINKILMFGIMIGMIVVPFITWVFFVYYKKKIPQRYKEKIDKLKDSFKRRLEKTKTKTKTKEKDEDGNTIEKTKTKTKTGDEEDEDARKKSTGATIDLSKLADIINS